MVCSVKVGWNWSSVSREEEVENDKKNRETNRQNDRQTDSGKNEHNSSLELLAQLRKNG